MFIVEQPHFTCVKMTFSVVNWLYRFTNAPLAAASSKVSNATKFLIFFFH